MALIYIVEDDQNIQEIEAFVLKSAGYEVQVFENAGDFSEAVREKLPEMIVLDIMLPDEDGLSVIRKLRMRKDTERIPVIMVTAKTTEMDKVRGLDLGADDYVTKPFGVMELISRVKALMRRSYPLGNEQMLQAGQIFIDDSRRSVYVQDELCELTFKEYELLKLLAENLDSAVTRDRIVQTVWGADYVGESRTLDMHIKTLRKKLGEAGSMIRTIRNVGYMLTEETV